MNKFLIISLIFSFNLLATNNQITIKDQITDIDINEWSEKISQFINQDDQNSASKIINFLSSMKEINNKIMQKAYNEMIIFRTLMFFESYFNNLTEGKSLPATKQTIENDNMYYSMLKFTEIIHSFLITKKNEAYINHDSILIFYKSYKQFNWVFGIVPVINTNNDIIYIPFVQEVKNKDKIKIESRFSNHDCSPIELYIKNKKIIESYCLFFTARNSFITIIHTYNGRFSDNKFCRYFIEKHLINISLKNVISGINTNKWDDNSYYIELFNSDFERLGFFQSFGNLDFTPINLLEYSEQNNFEEIHDESNTISNEYQEMLEKEWDFVKNRVLNSNTINVAKSKKSKHTKKPKINEQHQKTQINEAYTKRVKEIKNEIKSGRQKFRDMASMINQVLKLSNKNININQEGSHIVLSTEGKNPLTIVKLHNGKTISSNQAHKIFNDLIEFLF